MTISSKRGFKVSLSISVLIVLMFEIGSVNAQSSADFTVRDSIEIPRVTWGIGARQPGETGTRGASPTGRWIAVVTRKGNVTSGYNEHLLQIYDTKKLQSYIHRKDRAAGEVVAYRIESSNATDPIQAPQWVSENELWFICRDPNRGYLGEICSFDASTDRLSRITNLQQDITSFSVSADLNTVVFGAVGRPRDDIRNSSGYVVSGGQDYNDTVFPGGVHSRQVDTARDYFAFKRSSAKLVRLGRGVSMADNGRFFYMSPSGKWALSTIPISEVPRPWSRYVGIKDRINYGRITPNDWVQTNALAIPQDPALGQYFYSIKQWLLTDLDTGESRRIVDAPADEGCQSPRWSADERFVSLQGFLPFGTSVPHEGDLSQQKFDFDVSLDSGSIHNARLAAHVAAPAAAPSNPVEMQLSSGWDEPTEIVATETATDVSRKVTAWDASLKGRALGRTERFEWSDGQGKHWNGAVLYPPSYKPGRRYPAVIQTNIREPLGFFVDGASPEYAGRAVSARDIIVVTAGECDAQASPEGALGCYEAAVAELDRRALVDVNRVGIIGFSRSGLFVQYAATFAKHPFAAAVIVDSAQLVPDNYTMMYGRSGLGLAVIDASPNFLPAPLFGVDGISKWLETSPFFNFDLLQTPIRYQYHAVAPGEFVTPDGWSSFALLQRMHRPVELAILPNDEHSATTPRGRFFSEQSTVDWFDFWLNDHERIRPEEGGLETAQFLKDQYDRWHLLREQRDVVRSLPRPPRRKWTAQPEH